MLSMAKVQHFAFRKEYHDLSLRLTTEVEISDISTQKVKKVMALWDTGATLSAITPVIAQNLNLVFINRIKVNGVNSLSMADVAKISLKLPNQVTLQEINVAVCNLVEGVDMLIGMDIMKLGDLSISNGEGKTLFSFAIPSFDDKTDFYEKAIEINKNSSG